MKAGERKVEDFLSGNKRTFVIPVYQRNYDWAMPQCKQLLGDILEAGKSEKMKAHFIGSIVYIHDGVYTTGDVKELIIIDGQQRLTTLTIIYIVLYKLFIELKKSELADEIIETYLINKYVSNDLKLKPTENNEKAIQYLLRDNDNEDFNGWSKIIENYDYFRGQINEHNYQIILRGLSKLIFVEISLDRINDDPQRIFESLNSTGLELSQADLIRNYILMGLNHTDQKKIYTNYWKVIENLAKDETLNQNRVSDFIRDYLTLENKKIPNKSNVYQEFKAKYPLTTVNALEESLANIKRFAKFYNKLINPFNEQDEDIRLQIEYINRLEINVTFPFLLKIYDDFDSDIINKKDFINVLEFIQSYTWRRFIVGIPTNTLNKVFMSLYDKVDTTNYLYSVQKSLIQRTGSQRFPKNTEVIDALKVKDVYNIKPKNRVYFLDRLENHNNNEKVKISGNEKITIEHIFPQNPNPKWKEDLGIEEYDFIKDNFLNTIGNITLSGNNGKLSNKPFLEKRDLKDGGYKDSRLWLNSYLGKIDRWDKSKIEERYELLSKRFLEIWEYPPNITEKDGNGEFNIFEAESPTHKSLEYAIFFDQKIEVKTVTTLFIHVISKLFELEPETFFTTDLGYNLSLKRKSKKNELRNATPINDSYFIESNLDSNTKFERIKYALEIFGLEDELIIKYLNDF